MNAENIGFENGSFDVALCGFIGWDYCFDFVRNEFTRPDTRTREIARVLRDGGQIWISQWERQEDLDWMEEIFIRHFPAVEFDREFIRRRPIGYSRENADAYVTILKTAGFKEIEIFKEKAEFVSADEEAWWEQIGHLGWSSFFKRTGDFGSTHLEQFREDVFEDLRSHKHANGIHFTKSVLFAKGER